MWLPLAALLVTLALGLALGFSVSTSWAPYLGLLILVLLNAGLRALRRNLAGRYTNRGFWYHLLSTSAVVLGLGWLAENLSLGRVGSTPALTLALLVVLATRIFNDVDEIRGALAEPESVPSPYETYGPGKGEETGTREGRLP